MELFVLDRRVISQSYEVVKLQRNNVAKLPVVRTRAVRKAVLSPIMINIRSELLQCAQSHNVIKLSIHCSCFNCFKGYSTRSVQIQVKRHPLLSPYQNPRLTFQYFFLEQQLKNTLFKFILQWQYQEYAPDSCQRSIFSSCSYYRSILCSKWRNLSLRIKKNTISVGCFDPNTLRQIHWKSHD